MTRTLSTRQKRRSKNSERFRQHRTKLVRKVRCQIFRQIAWGNTAQRLCDRCVVKFFVRWNKKRSEYWMYSRAFLWNMRVCFVSDVCRLRRQIFWEMKGKTEKILCGFSSIFPKYLGKYARKMRAGRYETGSEGKFASRWRAKSPDALCAVLPQPKLRKTLKVLPYMYSFLREHNQ